jgi:hypothetical protein
MNAAQFLARIADLEGRIAELEASLVDARAQANYGRLEIEQRLGSLEDWRSTCNKPSQARLGLNKMAAAVGGALGKQD